MARYLWKKGQGFVTPDGEPMPMPKRDEICCPQIMRDIPDYISPVSGKPITSRSERREDLKRHDCVEAPPRRGGYKNLRFIEKHNIPLNKVHESVRDIVAKKRARSC